MVIATQTQLNTQFVWKTMLNTAEISASYTSQKMDTLSKNMQTLFSVSLKQIPNQMLPQNHGLKTLKIKQRTQ